MQSIRLAALDFSPVPAGKSSSEVIWQSIEMVTRLESWGYSRYWIGEHHGPGIAHSSPEVLIPVLAGLTTSIHIGAGGILLSLHRPLKIAKDFRLLNLLYPGRIDLGIARGAQGHESASTFTQHDDVGLSFEQKVSELLGHFRNTSAVNVNPQDVWPPELWMLGSGTVSLQLASTWGTCFCFAEFLAKQGTDVPWVVDRYLSRFQPSVDAAPPQCGIALAGVCARSSDEANRMASMAHTVAVRPTLVGDPTTCARRLRELRQQTGVTEFFFLDLCQDPTAHELSFRLLAEAVL